MRPEDTLTPSEFEAVALLARAGADDQELAEELGIAVRTVRKHLQRVRIKTGRKGRAALVIWFREKYATDEALAAGYSQACRSRAVSRGKALVMGRTRKLLGK